MAPPNERDPTPATGAEEPYDVLVARLESVVGELETGSLTLEQSIEKFAEGVRLAREASRKLDEAEKRVEMLVRGPGGEDEEVPLDPDAMKGMGPDVAR